MKTFIFSLLVLTLSFSFAQVPTQHKQSQNSTLSASQLSPETSRQEAAQTIEILLAENKKLHAALDDLLAVNARLDGQNYALKLRFKQLRSVDPRAAAQHKKMIQHNEKQMAVNDQIALQHAVKIEANQEAIQANKALLAEYVDHSESVKLASK